MPPVSISQQAQDKIAELSKKHRLAAPNVWSLCEDFYYSDMVDRYRQQSFCPILAGITHPSPYYHCAHAKQDLAAKQLYVLEYVVSGKGYIEVKGKSYEVHAGDTYLINRASDIRWYADPRDPYEKKWINFVGRFAEGMMFAFGMSDQVYLEHLDSEAQLDAIHQILLNYDAQNVEECNFQVMQQLLVVIEGLNRIREAKQKKATEKVSFDRILDYITANLPYKKLNPATVSYQFYISERTLSRMFARNLNISPAKYIMLQRIEYAKLLLNTTSYSVEAIASLLFFSSPRHFRNAFSEICGIPPSEWRKEEKKEPALPV